MSMLVIEGLEKAFGNVQAVRNFNLHVKDGEFISLLGPSGCGKTTTLRCIAGFEVADRGRIVLDDREITNSPPHTRNTGMVFQNYALFPHMTVFANVAFGLQMRKVPREETRRRVAKALEIVRLPGYEKRKPHELSGGQQQRVALARALVIEPTILLLDEPLSNLDAKLREEMRVEIRQIQKDVGITTVFVTHDQEEALVMSDRMVLMEGGEIVGTGTPIELFERPTNLFVASFLGQSNRVDGELIEVNGHSVCVRTPEGALINGTGIGDLKEGESVAVFVKCARVRLDPATGGEEYSNRFKAQVEFVTYLGETIQYLCSLSGKRIVATIQNREGHLLHSAGDEVTLGWREKDALVLNKRIYVP